MITIRKWLYAALIIGLCYFMIKAGYEVGYYDGYRMLDPKF